MAAKTDKSLYAWALLRVSLGFVFLWAFFDKLFGLGFATCRDKLDQIHTLCAQAWVHGGSPTSGFLGHATKGPLIDFYHKLAGKTWVDWLFMAGLAVVGIGLLLGVWVRMATIFGIMMMLLMWSSLLWPANNPFIDDHVINILALIGIYLTADRQVWSLHHWWAKTPIAKALPFLK